MRATLFAFALTVVACGSSTSTDATNDGGSTAAGSAGATAGGGSGAAGKAGSPSGGKAGAAGATQGGQAGSSGVGGAGTAGASAGAAGASAGAAGANAGAGGTAGAAGGAGTAGSAGNGAAGGTSGAGGGGVGGAGGASGNGAGGGGAAGTGGGGAGGAPQTPVRKIPGLESITFYETTGTTQSYTFLVGGPELSSKLPDPLFTGNRDIMGTGVEFYDVYYSDKDGAFQLDGAYLTISGVFPVALPAGGGLNLAEISLNYTAGSKEFGNYVASFVALGDNAVPADVMKAIDGNLGTWTTMGNTVGTTERLRLTLGFFSSSGKP